MKEELYPLKFKEIIRNYKFGNRKIPRLYPQKDLHEEGIIAETWEVTAHPSDPGTVINGSLEGATLLELMEDFGPCLVGQQVYKRYGDKFPLLLKILDAQKTLEVQIHPDDRYATEHNLDQLGKPEAWYVLEAQPDSFLYWGIKQGVTKRDFRKVGPNEQASRDLLMKVPVKKGDVLYLPPGRIHAIGKGIVLFEIQQTSDVTIGPDYLFCSGQKVDSVSPQEAFDMFMDQISIEEIMPEEARVPSLSLSGDGNRRTFLLATRYFALEELELYEEWTFSDNSGNEGFQILTNLEGKVSIEHKGNTELQLFAGQTVLIPAGLSARMLVPLNEHCKLLKSYVPDLRTDVVDPLLQEGFSKKEIKSLAGPGKENDLIPVLNQL